MKYIVFYFFLFFSNIGISQNTTYSIIIKDIETQLPIENATVVVLKNKQMLLSNKEGKVTFIINGSSNIQIYELNYEKLTLRWSPSNDNPTVVYLKNKNNKLDEIIISKEPSQKILQKIVSNSIQKLATPYRLKVYIREFFILNDKYSYYNDGLVNFQFSLHQKKITTTLLVEQNRSYGLLDTDVSNDLKGYNLNNLMENYCNFKYFEPLLEPEAEQLYDFIIKGYANNKEYYKMIVTPLQVSKNAIDSFEIIYNPESKLIIAFSITANPMALDKIETKQGINSKKITKSVVKVNYKTDGPDYYLANSNEEIGYDVILKEGVKKIQVRNSFITTHFSKQNFTYKDSDVYKEKTLFNKKNTILTNYWNVSGFIATDQEKALLNELEFKI